MATIIKKPSKKGPPKFEAQVCIGRRRKTKTFRTKLAAQKWGIEMEAEYSDDPDMMVDGTTVGELLKRYREDVRPYPHSDWHACETLLSMDISAVPCGALNASHVEELVSLLKEEYADGTVARYYGVLRAAVKVGVERYRYFRSNPLKGVGIEVDPNKRDYLISDREIADIVRMCKVHDIKPGAKLMKKQEIGIAFLLGIETGMRLGELCKMRWEHIREHGIELPKELSKTGKARSIPLSSEAHRLLSLLPRYRDRPFGLAPKNAASYFYRMKKKSGHTAFTFHDTRHLACTRMAGIFHHIELAKIMGHEDLKQTMRYYNPTMEMLAAKLNARNGA